MSGEISLPINPAGGGGGSGITQLTGDVTAGPGSGSQPATVAHAPWGGLTGVPASFTPSAHEATHVAGGSDPLPFTTIHGSGTLAARPAAAAGNAGYIYAATDTGDVYLSTGAAWTKIGTLAYGSLTGVPASFTPASHESTHLPGGTDALPWSTSINASGTLASRPAAAASNAGFTYLATDVNGGTEFLSTGAAWIQTGAGVSSSGSSSLSQYGDGSDGTVTFDGVATVLGMAPSGNVYTLTRDLYLQAGTINAGVTVATANYKVFCRGTLTNNGTISNDGNAGANGTSGTAAGGAATAVGSLPATKAGGNGAITTGVQGSAVTASEGGAGGAGGAGSSGAEAGGAGGTFAAPTAIQGSGLHSLTSIAAGQMFAGSAGTAVNGGSGGGGAGGAGTTNGGGGGGAGGGIIIILANAIAGTGSIHATGGAGGSSTTGNCGGGGGGGGGAVYIISSSVSGGAIPGQTITANGGPAGAATGTGANGIAGGAGTVRLLAA